MDLEGASLSNPHTSADFVKMVTPSGFTLPQDPAVVPDPSSDANGFHDVTPGTTLSFDVQAFNDFAPATAGAQLFRVTLRVSAGGCETLDTHALLVLVPPTPVSRLVSVLRSRNAVPRAHWRARRCRSMNPSTRSRDRRPGVVAIG